MRKPIHTAFEEVNINCCGVACNGKGIPTFNVSQPPCVMCDAEGHTDNPVDLCIICMPIAVEGLVRNDWEEEWGHLHGALVKLNPDHA